MLRVTPTDQTLRKLHANKIPDTGINREISFWNEPVVISWAYMLPLIILGSGLQVNSDNEDTKEIIRNWNARINASQQDISDLFTDVYVDNCIHGAAYWRILITDDSEYMVDLARIDPLTLAKIGDKSAGYEALVQAAKKDMKTFYTRSSFYNWVKERAPLIKTLSTAGEDVLESVGTAETKDMYIVIPNEPDKVIEFDFFRRPLISPILNQMAYKRWILWYMKEYAKRYWSPFRVGYVGDADNMPDDPEEFAQERDNLLQAMLKMEQFGAMATPGYNRIEETSRATARSSSIFIDSIGMLNEEFMFAMMGSMGLRSTSGTELATSRTLDQQNLRTIEGIKGKFDKRLTRFYLGVLLPMNGIKENPKEFSLRFPPTLLEAIYDTVRAVGEANKNLLFEDANEPRKILQSVFGTVLDELPKETAKKMTEKFVEMNTKSVGLGAPQGGAGSKPAASS
jgi:hypothetical protein